MKCWLYGLYFDDVRDQVRWLPAPCVSGIYIKKLLLFWAWKAGLLQLVSEHLVWILRITDNCVAVVNFSMVRTRQGTRTEPPSLERRGGNQGAQGWQDEDPLDDMASHAPIIPLETLQGEVAVAGEGGRPNQTEGVPPVAAEQQERSEAQPSTIPTGVPP